MKDRRKFFVQLSSILFAAALAVNAIKINTPAINNEIKEEKTIISFSNIQSDLEFSKDELLLSNYPLQNKIDDYQDEINTLSYINETSDEVIEPIKSKIATDYVEPEPIPLSRTITYQVRNYSEEEIAANALYPYKIYQNDWRTTYYESNMVDAIAVPYCPEYDNDNDIYQMAKIIHAEICGLGYEAQRCVGTVIINRAYSDVHPDSIYGVITESGQFSTAYTYKEPCEECMSAAYDILHNGYRSFPYYVDSFQAIRDGYFPNHLTYIAFNDGYYKTYFSYNPKNLYNEG